MKRVVPGLVFFVVTFCFLSSAPADSSLPKSPIGRSIDKFELRDFRGAPHSLSDWSKKRLLVVAFLGTECPLAKLYGVRLADFERRYASHNVGFVAIDANEQDTLAEMANYAKAVGIGFPFLKDPANVVADQFGAERTPEVFVLDQKRVIRYRGRIDDQYGIGFQRPHANRHDLALALNALLANKPVPNNVTPTIGCHIGRVNRKKPQGEVTYTKHIAPLLNKHCAACHRSGEVAPFPLLTYADATNWSATIREVVQEGRMPPWHAAGAHGKFVNDRRLTAAERKLLFDWIDHGMPEGAAADLPKPPQFTDGWQMAQPELILKMPKPYSVPATGVVEYQYFELPYSFPEDKWIVASEARPGNRAVVHHLILLYMPPGANYSPAEAAIRNSLGGFAPGLTAWRAPAGAARMIPAGSRLLLQAHYTPNGTATTDVSQVGLTFTDAKKVRQQLLTGAVINTQFQLPPRTDSIPVEGSHAFARDVELVSLLAHMHLRGKSFQIDLIEPTGKRTQLLSVPRYDFNWQNAYVFPKPLKLAAGSRLQCYATYNNSKSNPANPNPDQYVGWGDQTWEEMFLAQYEILIGR